MSKQENRWGVREPLHSPFLEVFNPIHRCAISCSFSSHSQPSAVRTEPRCHTRDLRRTCAFRERYFIHTSRRGGHGRPAAAQAACGQLAAQRARAVPRRGGAGPPPGAGRLGGCAGRAVAATSRSESALEASSVTTPLLIPQTHGETGIQPVLRSAHLQRQRRRMPPDCGV